MARYAVSDLHGMKVLYDAIVDFIQPEDTVYFLGDAADRGPDGWAIIKALLDNPQFVYIKGNHEDMLLAAAGVERRGMYENPRSLVYYNGGGKTFEDYKADPQGAEVMARLKDLPTDIHFTNDSGLNIHLSHAGYTPPVPALSWNLLWDRDHFFNKWPEGCDNDVIVHGHTPIPYLVDEINHINHHLRKMPAVSWENGAFYYAGTHKICIDCGSAFTGQTVLLDLDTFDEHIFQCEVEES